VRSLCTRCRTGDFAVITRMPQLRTRSFGMSWFAAGPDLAAVQGLARRQRNVGRGVRIRVRDQLVDVRDTVSVTVDVGGLEASSAGVSVLRSLVSP